MLSPIEQTIVEAADQNVTVEIQYEGQLREIEPLSFKEGKFDALLVAKCRLRGALRSFAMSKIQSVRLVGNSFVREVEA